MAGRGGRPRALVAVLFAAMVATLLGSVRPPLRSTGPCADGYAGLEADDQLRLGCVAEVERWVAERREGCPEKVAVTAGASVALQGCAARTGRLPLGVTRTLELPIDLNALSAADFESLPGIGPALSRRIVEIRREKGGFEGVEELDQVPGIGPAKLATLRSLLVVKAR